VRGKERFGARQRRTPNIWQRSRPRSGSEGGPSPRGSLLPHQRSVPEAAAPAPTTGGHSGPDGTLPGKERAGFPPVRPGIERREAADQLQGPAVQAEADWMHGIRNFLTLWRKHEDTDQVRVVDAARGSAYTRSADPGTKQRPHASQER